MAFRWDFVAFALAILAVVVAVEDVVALLDSLKQTGRQDLVVDFRLVLRQSLLRAFPQLVVAAVVVAAVALVAAAVVAVEVVVEEFASEEHLAFGASY